jgi:choline dehydrogenase
MDLVSFPSPMNGEETGGRMLADYVVVGAGSAGCVVASRLSETGASVILLEAGPTDWHPMIHIPAGMRSLIRNPLVNWNYTTEPEKGTYERRMEWPRGRVMGGSSSINGMLYVRGAPADFDGWAQMGNRGGLRRAPTSSRALRAGARDPELRGQGRPLKVEDYRPSCRSPITSCLSPGRVSPSTRPQRQAAPGSATPR